ncbi:MULTISPECIES: hypothetical protein [Agrobacterium]|uniref:hypothetical protein n=1 Tax=Agrobacterium TaxID=357 RepID=UPI00179CE0FF|nr:MULTISPECIES: hypothetical protein [Agrobacterium]MBA4774469.1 hypothetical protein [Hyphomicrobiales bacterium]MCZ7858806.1 hypothetical protein [Agrobacterium salinitolerans]MCZ7886291.1 hypothetical protein [Agrobacterium salinitolerans]MDA5629501.1 hypothetical protein [Agrobacterium sp. ST15.16.055]MDA6979501.1 hypothetical protein [Agrobacterium salinitolerans]
MNDDKSRSNRVVSIRKGAPGRGSATPGGWCASNVILAMMASLVAAVVALEVITG